MQPGVDNVQATGYVRCVCLSYPLCLRIEIITNGLLIPKFYCARLFPLYTVGSYLLGTSISSVYCLPERLWCLIIWCRIFSSYVRNCP